MCNKGLIDVRNNGRVDIKSEMMNSFIKNSKTSLLDFDENYEGNEK